MINLFKQNTGFSTSTFNGKVIDGVEQIPEELEGSLLIVEDNIFNDLKNHKVMWENGAIVNNPNYEEYLQEQQVILQQIEAQQLRSKREPILKAFDIYKTNVSYGVYNESIIEHNQIIVWYNAILDLDEEAINNVPEQIARFM